MRGLLVAVVVSLLVGCGFHLRGSSVSVDVASAYVREGANVTIGPELNRLLSQSRVKLLDSADGAAVVIDLREQQQHTRTLSYTDRATTAESELSLQVRFALIDAAGQVLVDDRWARATRTYLVDTNNLVGSNQQQQLMGRELVGDVAQQIIRSLNAATRPKAH